MLSCGSEVPVCEIALGENGALKAVGALRYGKFLPLACPKKHVASGVPVASPVPCGVATMTGWLCDGNWLSDSVTFGTPCISPMTVVGKPVVVPQCIGI